MWHGMRRIVNSEVVEIQIIETNCFLNGLGPISDLQFFENLGDVIFYGVVAYVEDNPNFLIGFPVEHPFQNFDLPFAKRNARPLVLKIKNIVKGVKTVW